MPRERNKIPLVSPQQLKHLLELHFDFVPERSFKEELCIICPEGCGDRTGNRFFNLKTNFTNCWRCGSSSTAPKIALLWLKHQGIEVDAVELVTPIELTPVDQFAENQQATAESISAVQLPAGFTRLDSQPNSCYVEFIEAMAKRKNLELEDFVQAGVGFTKEGSWEPFAIFPVVELNRTVYYQGRTYSLDTEGSKTKKFPGHWEVALGASNWLYNFNEIVKPDTEKVVIVESILNVLSWEKEMRRQGVTGIKAACVFKHAISPPQMRKLLASPAKEFVIIYDDDAIRSAWAECAKLNCNRRSTVVRMPKKVDVNDNALLAWERFQERKGHSPLNALADIIS